MRYLNLLWISLALGLGAQSCSPTKQKEWSLLGRFTTHKGNGVQEKRSLNLGAFHSIEVGQAFDVVVHTGEACRGVLSGDANLLDFVQVKVRQGTLIMEWIDSASYRVKQPMVLELWLPSLAGAEISGAATLNAKGLNQGDLSLDVSGAGQAEVEGELKHVVAEISGASELKLAVRLDSLTANCSGASDLSVTGRVGYLEGGLSGASSLHGRDCENQQAVLDLSGSSDAKVTVSEVISASCSGASQLDYWGTARVRLAETSGSSDITHR